MGRIRSLLRRLLPVISALCLVTCGIVIVLWVRSYHTRDVLVGQASKSQLNGLISVDAKLMIGRFRFSPQVPLFLRTESEVDAILAADPQMSMWQQQLVVEQMQAIKLSGVAKGGRSRQSVNQQRKIAHIQQQIAQYRAQMKQQLISRGPKTRAGFGILRQPNVSAIVVPHWFVVLITAAIAAAPWIKWRFSLRTLLVATTLLAIVLGMLMAVNDFDLSH